jgi:hypothetical protein
LRFSDPTANFAFVQRKVERLSVSSDSLPQLRRTLYSIEASSIAKTRQNRYFGSVLSPNIGLLRNGHRKVFGLWSPHEVDAFEHQIQLSAQGLLPHHRSKRHTVRSPSDSSVRFAHLDHRSHRSSPIDIQIGSVLLLRGQNIIRHNLPRDARDH